MANRFMLASFSDVEEAAEAYNQLAADYFDTEDISVITTESVRDEFDEDVGEDTDEDIGVGEGMAKGAVSGGLLGLIVSAVPIAIGGIPSLIVVGPIAAALGLSGVAATTATSAVAGGAIGGLVGALDNLGIEEEEAREFEQTVKQGGVLLAVPVSTANEDEVRDILENSDADTVMIGETV